MRKWSLRILGAIVLVALLGGTFLWAVLAVSYFSDFRRQLVAEVLTEQLGQPVQVNGDVNAVVGTITKVNAAEVVIPSNSLEGVTLAELQTLSFDVNLLSLLDGFIDLNNLIVEGLEVQLLTTQANETSWSRKPQAAVATSKKLPDVDDVPENTEGTNEEDAGSSSNLLSFLRSRTVRFADIGLVVANDISGFEFDFLLSEFTLDQEDGGATLVLASTGSVNGQDFELEGRYPEGAQFTTRASFSTIALSYDGDPLEDGYTGVLDIQISELGDVLDVFKLDRTLEGQGALTAQIARRNGVTSVSGLDTNIDLAEGQKVTVTGDIATVSPLGGFDIAIDLRLHPAGQPPAPAREIKDFKLTGISSRIISVDQELEFDDLLMTTNAFSQGLDKLGPVSIGRIRRTEDGDLAMEDISLQAGPIDAPYLAAQGNIRSILELKDLDIAGELDIPASLALQSLGDDVADAFGRVEAAFEVNDAQGSLSLTELSMRSVDSDVWALSADVKVGDVLSLNGLAVDASLDVADGASFLSALNLEPVNTGPLRMSTSITGQDGTLAGELGLGAGASQVTGTLEIREEDRRRIDAAIRSPSLALNDLKNAIAGIVELGKISSASAEELPLQPLVLSTEDPNLPELQPLVLPVEADLADPVAFLQATDIYATVDFERISGIQGVTQMSSEVKSEGGKASLGPLEFNYGGGYFRFGATMDLINTPDRAAVSGATSGWDLGQILAEAGVSIDASGPIRGQFDLAGRITSVEAFLNSMTGSAQLSIGKGQIATSLLELAGLGVFPWLFSTEFAQGYTDIVCVRAPVRISGSKVQFDSVVAETRSVQLVARGALDWSRDTISLRAEPRRVGKPLARAAWPIDVTGALSAPNIKLDIGGSRSRRADGADEMPAERQPCEPDIYQLQ